MKKLRYQYLKVRSILKARVSTISCLYMFVTFIDFSYKSTFAIFMNLTTIEILVLLSWIPASKEFLEEILRIFYHFIILVKSRLLIVRLSKTVNLSLIHNFRGDTIKIITIRSGTNFKELVPIRRLWRYPLYFGNNSFYEYDIAVIELGKKFPLGHTEVYIPICKD